MEEGELVNKKEACDQSLVRKEEFRLALDDIAEAIDYIRIEIDNFDDRALAELEEVLFNADLSEWMEEILAAKRQNVSYP